MTAQQPDWREVRVGRVDHWTQDPNDLTGRTLCGIWLSGTPVSPGQGTPCNDCQDRLPCDECDHPGTDHINAWGLADATATTDAASPAAQYVFDHATCWAENVCKGCDPSLHAAVLAMLPATAVAS